MATTIRLKRMGAKKEASYRIVVTDSREGTSGASIERLGTYNPRTEPSWVRLDAARTLHWLREGAEPSDTVRSILKKTGLWQQFYEGVEPSALEEATIELGPPPGQRGTSQRPAPQDKPAPETPAPETPAPEAKEAKAAKEASDAAETAEDTEATEDAGEEATEEPVAEAAEAEADETAEAEAEEAPADETPEEATAEADEGASADAEEEADAEEDDEKS